MKKSKYSVEVPDIDYWKKQIKRQYACPVHTDSRGYVRAIAQGDYEKAYLIARGPKPLVRPRIYHLSILKMLRSRDKDSGDLLLKILDKDIDLAIIDENLTGMASYKLIKIIKKSRPGSL